jgi:hypothetical protein
VVLISSVFQGTRTHIAPGEQRVHVCVVVVGGVWGAQPGIDQTLWSSVVW